MVLISAKPSLVMRISGNKNLSRATLCEADLRGADLRGAILSEANLQGAILRGANLSGQDLSNKNLSKIDLSGANLCGANLNRADLSETDLSGANLSSTNLSKANLRRTNLRRTNLRRTTLCGQDLSNKNLSEADLSGADLTKTLLIGTDFTGATLTDCIIYGIAAWNVQLENAKQENLIITPKHEATITIDNLKVAQFIYLMLNNEEIRDVINTLTTKSVLILGRFTPSKRKAVLEALRKTLRNHNYLPILFDFEKPRDRNLTETVRTLAHLVRFIIADLTETSSIPQELQAIIPTLAIPVQPILLENKREYAMFHDFSRYHWVLPTYVYEDQISLLSSIEAKIIQPAEKKAKELEDAHK